MQNTRILALSEYFCRLLETDTQGLREAVRKALSGAEDGELFLSRTDSENVSLNEERIEEPGRDIEQGFGLRRVNGKSVCFASGSNISLREIARMGRALRQAAKVRERYIPGEQRIAVSRYANESPLVLPLSKRVVVLRAIDTYARATGAVTNVEASLLASYTQILIVRADGTMAVDQRPLVRMNVAVQCEENGKREQGSATFGGRHGYTRILEPGIWMPEVDEAKKIAGDKLRAGPCPSGPMTVVLGPGWGGLLLHEAVGHGLEGDFVWRNETVFANGDFGLGKRIGSKLVTVVDDGTLQDRRGSLSIDDEGTPTERTVLIDKGVLVSFMHDRQSARLCGAKATGNGRRESYGHRPQVRMRNTFMLSGESTPEEIIAATNDGLYIPSFGGGQVDPVSGPFVFKSDLAYIIKNGKITTPVIGATLIDNCTTILMQIDMVGNDSVLDHGTGTCGKGGQHVPVGVGQPTLRLARVTVGGTL